MRERGGRTEPAMATWGGAFVAAPPPTGPEGRALERTVCHLSDIEDGRALLVEVEGLELALFRRGEEVFALENSCPHRGGSLASGDLKGEVVYCPLHAWPFDLRSGRCLEFPEAPVRIFPVRVEGGKVRVEL